MTTPKFKIIGAPVIQKWLDENCTQVINTVEQAYRLFKKGDTVCPDSYFLRFPTTPENRIIALPASIESGKEISGIKWIASYPNNVNKELDRASATITLNSRTTGYPIACMEGSLISAYRTAASAILGATHLHPTQGHINRLSIVGAGLIAKTIISLFESLEWTIKEVNIIDLDPDRAAHFQTKFPHLNTLVSSDISTISSSDMIVFTTSAIEPYVQDVELFDHNPTVLHMSLRDISTNIISASQNFVDNADHAVKANTSLHLTEKLEGNRSFVTGDIVDLLDNTVKVNFSKPRIFAPFGMGILDISLGYEIYESCEDNDIIISYDFFPIPYTASEKSNPSLKQSVPV